MSQRLGGSDDADRDALRAAALWGVVATLAYLVFVQGYRLLEFGSFPLSVVALVGVVVFVVTTLLTYVVGP